MAEPRPPLPPPGVPEDEIPAGLDLPPDPPSPSPEAGSEGADPKAAARELPASAYATLKPRHRRFVDAYLKYGVGSKAYHEVYPDHQRPDIGASKLLSHPDIWASVLERDAYCSMLAGITQTRLKIEMARIAFADPEQLVDENGETLPLHKIPLETRVAIASVEVEDIEDHKGKRVGRRFKYRFNSKNEMLRTLVQTESMIVARHEHTGRGGGPIKTLTAVAQSVDDLTDDQLQAIARAGLPAPPEPPSGED